MRSKKGKPKDWLKMPLSIKSVMEGMTDVEVGNATKAVYHYWETGEILDLTPVEMGFFSVFKKEIDTEMEKLK